LSFFVRTLVTRLIESIVRPSYRILEDDAYEMVSKLPPINAKLAQAILYSRFPQVSCDLSEDNLQEYLIKQDVFRSSQTGC